MITHSLISISVDDLLKNSFIQGVFNRMDIIIKHIAIDHFYGKNDYGFELYEKLYPKPGGRVERFKRLIKSFEENGFVIYEHIPIPVTESYELLDEGSHRVTCCLYFGIGKIFVQPRKEQNGVYPCVKKGKPVVRYLVRAPQEWIRGKGYSQKEENIIIQTYNEIIKPRYDHD